MDRAARRWLATATLSDNKVTTSLLKSRLIFTLIYADQVRESRGGAYRDRTDDLLRAKQTLSRLS